MTKKEISNKINAILGLSESDIDFTRLKTADLKLLLEALEKLGGKPRVHESRPRLFQRRPLRNFLETVVGSTTS